MYSCTTSATSVTEHCESGPNSSSASVAEMKKPVLYMGICTIPRKFSTTEQGTLFVSWASSSSFSACPSCCFAAGCCPLLSRPKQQPPSHFLLDSPLLLFLPLLHCLPGHPVLPPLPALLLLRPPTQIAASRFFLSSTFSEANTRARSRRHRYPALPRVSFSCHSFPLHYSSASLSSVSAGEY